MPLVAVLLAVLAVACTPGAAEPGERPVVVASTTVFADLVAQVAGDAVEVRSVVSVGGDSHVFEPRPSDAVAVTTADLVVAMLVIPGATARLLTTRLGPMMLTAAAVGTLSAVVGLYTSFSVDVASGPAIVLAAGACFAVAFTLRLARGRGAT